MKITLLNYIYFILKFYCDELVSNMNCVSCSELLAIQEACFCLFTGCK